MRAILRDRPLGGERSGHRERDLPRVSPAHRRRDDPPGHGRPVERARRDARDGPRRPTRARPGAVRERHGERWVRCRDPRRQGTPHRRINGIAETVRADLTVVGSRGQSPLENRASSGRRPGTSPGRPSSRCWSTGSNAARTNPRCSASTCSSASSTPPTSPRTPSGPSTRSPTSGTRPRRRRSSTSSRRRTRAPRTPEDRLADLASTLEEWDIATETRVRQGDPGDEILAVEDEVTPTTTLVGSRGRSRLRWLMLGERLRGDRRPGRWKRLPGAAAADGLK